MKGHQTNPNPPDALPQAPDAPAEKKELRKKRCKNCPKFFQQSKPWQDFCSAHCRMEFHRNRAGYGKLLDRIPKWIEKEVAKQLAVIVAALPKPGLTEKEIDVLLLDYDFVARRELTPTGITIVRNAARRKHEREAAEAAKK